MNFNGQHGCLKCCTIGEFSHLSNTNVFPRTECERRTDEKFRKKLYGSHHKIDSPLLKLKIDMIEQFPVADSLHLLHLGNMKRLLFGWRDGTFRYSETKWASRTTIAISEYLNRCKMPAEFQRSVRGLDCLSHWKGTQYRAFLHYIGFVALKDHLQHETYQHFLLLFCAATICSSKQYFQYLPIARALLNDYIEVYKEIYGEQYVTSNVHNLTHLVDEVERFGELDTFSTYPFENTLGKIKRLIRSGNKPLSQVAKRMAEGIDCSRSDKNLAAQSENADQTLRVMSLIKRNDGENVPDEIKSSAPDAGFYSKVDLGKYCLTADQKNSWFLTQNNEITCLLNIMLRSEDDVQLCCVSTSETQNFFQTPFESRYLDIFSTRRDAFQKCKPKLLRLSEIKCKLVCLEYHEMNVFVPLLHTKQ